MATSQSGCLVRSLIMIFFFFWVTFSLHKLPFSETDAQQEKLKFSHGYKELRLQLMVLGASGFSTLTQKAALFTVISR